MGHPTDTRLRDVFNTLEPLIEQRYGIPVRIRDVPNPFTGDVDGSEIHVDYDIPIAEAVFVIAHLFGHTVQWNLSEDAREIGSRVLSNPTDEELRQLHEYEVEACRYSLQLFHDAGIHDLDQWLSDFAACDYAYLENFYRTGAKAPFESFWKDGQTLLTPLSIPNFSPTKWHTRWDGVVI